MTSITRVVDLVAISFAVLIRGLVGLYSVVHWFIADGI